MKKDDGMMFDAVTLKLIKELHDVIHEYTPDQRAHFSKVLEFAMWAHKEQKRDGGEAYINHPIRVAMYVKTMLGVKKIEYLMAALLHDVLEDTSVEYHTIADKFGEFVAQVVHVLSKLDKPGAGVAEEEIVETYFRRINLCNSEVKLIKIADRINNLDCINGWKPERKENYIAETLKYIVPMAASLGPDVATAVESALAKAGK